jgi:NTE family protein
MRVRDIIVLPDPLLRQVSDPGNSEGVRWAGMRIHRVASEMMTDLGASSKLNAEAAFLHVLKEEGRKATEEFLTSHGEDLGKRSTADLDILLLEC